MVDMNTIRLTVTTDLKREIDFLRMMEYPTLTDAEIVKVAVGAQAVKSRKAVKKVVEYDNSDPSLRETLLVAQRSFDLGEEEEEPFWDETKLKPFVLKKHV